MNSRHLEAHSRIQHSASFDWLFFAVLLLADRTYCCASRKSARFPALRRIGKRFVTGKLRGISLLRCASSALSGIAWFSSYVRRSHRLVAGSCGQDHSAQTPDYAQNGIFTRSDFLRAEGPSRKKAVARYAIASRRSTVAPLPCQKASSCSTSLAFLKPILQ